MLTVLRICVGLGARKNEEVTFALLNVSLELDMSNLPRTCVGLRRFSNIGSRLMLVQTWELRMNDLSVGIFYAYAWIFYAFYAYAWIFYACAWMNEASGSLGHVWACLDVSLECELLASHAYAWTSTPMRGKGKPRCYA
ncbi:hypothetical protein PIB30_060142 [Stylosanthes scabra]|uniref:Uncharacterized protein n=1 Tax=Stylosanthes scabra TaxID=79078 RepID=A0ABU6QLF8_9FABA|nr:hypothetical protein [Stylosanthes scabra]